MAEEKTSPVRLKLDRLITLSDGVTAIVMTILVLSIEIPADHDFSRNGVLAFLHALSHDVVIYAVSFLLVGAYWVQHHSLLHYAEYGNRTLVWLHLLFLLLLSLVPLTTQLKATYRDQPAVVLILVALHMAIGFALGGLWLYLQRRPWLLRRRVEPAVARSIVHRMAAGQAICIAAALAAYVDIHWGPMILLGIPLLYVSNRQLDLHWNDPGEATEHRALGEGTGRR